MYCLVLKGLSLGVIMKKVAPIHTYLILASSLDFFFSFYQLSANWYPMSIGIWESVYFTYAYDLLALTVHFAVVVANRVVSECRCLLRLLLSILLI